MIAIVKNNLIKNKLPIIISIISIGLAVWPDSILSPSYASFFTEFNNTSEFITGYIMSGYYFVSIPFVLIAGKVAEKVDKKLMIIIAMTLSSIMGIMGGLVANIVQFAMCRTITGICVAIIGMLAYSIIFDTFNDINISAKIVGFYQGGTQVFGTLIGLAAGFMGLQGWRFAQYLNAVAFIAILLIFIFLPSKKKDGAVEVTSEAGEENYEAESEYVIHGKADMSRVIFTLIEAILLIGFSFVYTYYMSLYIFERALGTSVLAGTLISLNTIGAVLLNMVYGKVFTTFKRYTGVVAFFVGAVIMTIMGFNIPVFVVTALSLVNGMVNAIACSSYSLFLSQYVPKAKTTVFMSFYSTSVMVAVSLVGFIPVLYMSFFKCGYQQVMSINGIVLGVLGLLFFTLIKTFIGRKPTVK